MHQSGDLEIILISQISFKLSCPLSCVSCTVCFCRTLFLHFVSTKIAFCFYWRDALSIGQMFFLDFCTFHSLHASSTCTKRVNNLFSSHIVYSVILLDSKDERPSLFPFIKNIWTDTWEKGTYHTGKQWRLRRACAFAQSHQSRCCLPTQYRNLEGASDKEPDPFEWLDTRIWRISNHAKVPFLMRWLICGTSWQARSR